MWVSNNIWRETNYGDTLSLPCSIYLSMRTRRRCLLFSNLGLHQLSASLDFSFFYHYILRNLTTMFSISVFWSSWCPLEGWQPDTPVLIRGIMVPTIGCWKMQQNQFLFFHTKGNPSTALYYEGRTSFPLWKELVCQCLAVKPVWWLVCMRGGGASVIHVHKGRITWSASIRR